MNCNQLQYFYVLIILNISNIFDEYENRKEREEKTMISTGRLLTEEQTEKQ